MSANPIATLAACALRLADAHRAERDAQLRYTDATATVRRAAIFPDSDQYHEAEDAQELAFRDHKAALEAQRAALAELVAAADEWNAISHNP